MIEVRISNAVEIRTTPTMLASQLGIWIGPTRWRAIKLMASLVRLNRTMAVASEISMNRACTKRNRTTANAMMTRAAD